MTTEDWQIVSAVSATLAALGTLALAWIAIYQLGHLRAQIAESIETERRRHTLEVCGRYENNERLREAMKAIWEKSNCGSDYTRLDKSDHFHALTILNYLSGVACGIEQGLIIEPLAKDYLQSTVDKSVKAFIRGESGPGWKSERSLISPDGFESLVRVQEAWSSNKPAYKL